VYNPLRTKSCNKLDKNFHLANKKAFFCNLRKYYIAAGKNPFDYIPLTYHIRSGVEDPEFQRFSTEFARQKALGQSIWIVKPGEYTN
jgi:tubulin--tyrosine ligase